MSLAARRAIVRWSWRLFRREWRQQLLILLLLTLTVAGAVFGSVAARSLAPNRDGEFGSADHQLILSPGDPAEVAATVAALRERFGTVDLIGSRRVPIPGSVDAVEYRSQDPNGPYSEPMVGLRSGRYPAGDEVAVTEDMATALDVAIGDHLDLDGVDRAVVGIVENPADTSDQFALLAPGDPKASSHTALVRTDEVGPGDIPADIDGVADRGDAEGTVAAVAALALAVVVAILVCLVAAAGFVVIAHRRIRQLGMLASLGATERHLRLVVLGNGIVVGAVSAVAGTVVAGIAWLLASPTLERAAGHRLNRFDVPWWIVASGMALALVTSTAAAWWPGRAVARIPVHLALSARPPGPRPVRRSALAAALLIGAGFAGLAIGLDPTDEEANVALVLPGIASLVLGILLISPVAVRSLGPLGRRLPIAPRLALRDLARHQARSGMALAAITLSLGLAVATVVVAGAAEHDPGEGNLSDRQLLVRLGSREPVLPQLTDAELDARRAAVVRFAGDVDAETTALDAAITASVVERRDGVVYHPFAVLGIPVGDVTRDVGDLYVATPELARRLGVELDQVDDRTDLLTVREGALRLANTMRRKGEPVDEPVVEVVDGVDVPAHSSAPTSLLTPAALARFGLTRAPAGWLVETAEPLTVEQIDQARTMAVGAGLTVETRDRQGSLGSVQRVATAVGIALALAILAMTVGLVRGEAANDVRTLAATGAPASTRRAIVAATAGVLALLGVVIGTAGAYLAVVASYLEDLHPLTRVPVGSLLATALGVPLLAAAAGWLFAGREPPLTRPAID